MKTALDVEPNIIIKKVAESLKGVISKPAYIDFVKSGAHAERPPEQEDFWYIRCASILRHAYANPVVGVNRLRRHYGGRKNRGLLPEKHRPAGGKIIRDALRALEAAGFLERAEHGRKLSAKGRSFLDKVAKEA
ncbi:MAG: 30S ribosomal protein S19e [Candidatus Anstonellales archaeon]